MFCLEDRGWALSRFENPGQPAGPSANLGQLCGASAGCAKKIAHRLDMVKRYDMELS